MEIIYLNERRPIISNIFVVNIYYPFTQQLFIINTHNIAHLINKNYKKAGIWKIKNINYENI